MRHFIKIMFNFFRSAEHAIQTIVYCATDANLSEQTGLYYSDCAVQLTPDKAADMEDAYRYKKRFDFE